MSRFYTGLVGFHQDRSSAYPSMQNRHINSPSTIANRFPRVDIKPQFLQTCLFGCVSVMFCSPGWDYTGIFAGDALQVCQMQGSKPTVRWDSSRYGYTLDTLSIFSFGCVVRLGNRPSSRIHFNGRVRTPIYKSVIRAGEGFLSFSSTIHTNLKTPGSIQDEYRLKSG